MKRRAPSAMRARDAMWAGALAGCLGIALAASSGCEGIPEPEESRDFVENSELEGFPCPPGFEFRRGHRFQPVVVVGGGFRPQWTGYYRGPGRPEDHAPFYVREMKLRGWSLRRVLDRDEASKILEFTRGEEGTTIELSRVFDSRRGGYACDLRAEVRTLGPEEFSVEENFRLAGGNAPATSRFGTEEPERAASRARGLEPVSAPVVSSTPAGGRAEPASPVE